MGDSGVVIDLGVLPEARSTEAAGPPRAVVVRWWRTAAAALAALLVLSAGGATPSPPPPLREVYAAPVEPSGSYQLLDGLLITTAPVTTADQPGRRITAFDLAERRQLWSIHFATERSGRGGNVASRLTMANELLLVDEELGGYAGVRTTAVDPRTGRTRWTVPTWLSTLPSGSIALVFDSVFDPKSRIEPGQLGTSEAYISADGYAYSRPPTGRIVRAIDLDTGRLRWESAQLDAAVLVPAAASRPAVLLTMPVGGAGVEVWDVASGTLRHRLDWPGGEPISATRVGDVVAVSRFGPDPGVAAYTADLRQRRWSRSLTGPNPFVLACGPLLCQPDMSGTVALDPATGETRWQLADQVQFLATDSRLVEFDDSRRLRRVVDPATGRTVGDLDDWRLTDLRSDEDHFRADAPAVVLRPNAAAQQTELGLFDPAAPSIRPLGVLPYVLGECSTAGRYLACRTGGGEFRVWRYSPRHRHG